MAMTRPASGYRRRGRRDGVGFIWFTLIAMPFLMLSLALATDFARLVMVGHEMRNVADASAVAAAWQIQPGTVVLDEHRAMAAAEETACAYTSHVAGVQADPALISIAGCDHSVSMAVLFDDHNQSSATRPGTGYTRARVEIAYRVDGLIFPAYFGVGERYVDGLAVKDAAVCLPGDSDNFSGGFCSRPVDLP